MDNDYRITSEEQLASILGEPSALVKQKVCASLDDVMAEFVRRSPLVVLSTVDARGLIDTSPKGDAPGFVQLDQDGSLLIPERPGNKLAYGFKNLLVNPNIGLIFIAPTMTETLRIKGKAVISNDPALLEQLSARGKPALLCLRVEVTECFFHCGKAMIRSDLWQPERWIKHSDSLISRHLAGKLKRPELTEETITQNLDQSYQDNLY